MSADERTQRTAEEEAVLIARRKAAEAEAAQADERARIRTLGSAAIGIIGLVIGAVALLVNENVAIGVVGLVAAAIGFGVITASEGAKLLGRDK